MDTTVDGILYYGVANVTQSPGHRGGRCRRGNGAEVDSDRINWKATVAVLIDKLKRGERKAYLLMARNAVSAPPSNAPVEAN